MLEYPDMRMRFRYGSRHRIQPLDGVVRKQRAAAMKQEGCNIQTVQRVQSPAETQSSKSASVSRRENDAIASDDMGSDLTPCVGDQVHDWFSSAWEHRSAFP